MAKFRYKLTDQKMRTHNDFQWELGKWVTTSGEGELCTDGWLHCYSHPLVAVLLNPIHADIKEPRMWKVEVAGDNKTNRGLKEGWTRMRLVKELPVPEITKTQRVALGILCAMKVYVAPTFQLWATNWLSGIDRSDAAAYVADVAAYAADVADVAAYAADVAAYAADVAANAAYAAAYAAYATRAAHVNKPLNLIAIAKQAMKIK